MSRAASTTQLLARAGFANPRRAGATLCDPALVGALARADLSADDLVGRLGEVADPDGALVALARLAQASPDGLAEHLAGTSCTTLLKLAGVSVALTEDLIRNPVDLGLLYGTHSALRASREQVTRSLLDDIAGGGGVEALRASYRRRVIHIAGADLTHEKPLEALPAVAAALADAAGAALEGALAIARARVGELANGVELAIIGMGKAGGRELNYVSDVDVLYVARPGSDVVGEKLTQAQALEVAVELAREIAKIVGRSDTSPALWQVDANLRPEGKDGPLVRTLESYEHYYRKWAQTWEFQALLKARPLAGSAALGEEFVRAVTPLVWEASARPNFVADCQAMRQRVIDNLPAREAQNELKLAPGGLRDIEFTVQLLQLVHGRTDTSIRSATTLTALEQLRDAGYISREHAASMSENYRFLRLLEHRVQLRRMRRTHMFPSSTVEQRWLARSLHDPDINGASELVKRWQSINRQVRDAHQNIYFRPLLPAAAGLSAPELALSKEAVGARLAAIGYRDPRRATQHIAVLSEGISRRAAIQRQLLPVLLGWFAQGPDPDGGLLAFRRLSEKMGRTQWYLKLLRDSGSAAQHLCRLLSSSRYVAEGIEALPEAVTWLDDRALAAPGRTDLEGQARSLVSRAQGQEEAIEKLRFLRRREYLRAAMGQILGILGQEEVSEALSAVTEIVVQEALDVVIAGHAHNSARGPLAADLLVVAMGRLGGREITYCSDADVLFVYSPHDGVEDSQVAADVSDIFNTLVGVLGSGGGEPPLEIDSELRPEGRSGPIARSLESYAVYYRRWISTWEAQALLRARPIAGSRELARQFVELIDVYRYPAEGLTATQLKDFRLTKARVENERLPRGVPGSRHVKLGRGAIADVEWAAQLLQLTHAGARQDLRTPSTLEALNAAVRGGLLTEAQRQILARAWSLASRIRSANVLATGRTTGYKIDVLSDRPGELEACARILGYPPGHRHDLEDDYLGATRRCRTLAEEIIYGRTGG